MTGTSNFRSVIALHYPKLARNAIAVGANIQFDECASREAVKRGEDALAGC
jgi:hypothetical protein